MPRQKKFRSFDELCVGELYWIHNPSGYNCNIFIGYPDTSGLKEAIQHLDVLLFLGMKKHRFYPVDVPHFMCRGVAGELQGSGVSLLRHLRRVTQCPPGGWQKNRERRESPA